MTSSSFEQVIALDEQGQRHLLATGDALERVWAAWAIGLRQSRAALPTLRPNLL
jgi:hypothetical protein